MKQQFLDLKGLTELVSYLKDSIANKKVILPYASNTLFPSVGDINSVYIDTATNSIYRWDSSNKKYEILAQAIKSVAISEATENGKITLTVDGKKTTVPIHGLGSAAYTNSSAYSPAGHTHTKAQVGLGNVDNTADKDKSVKHATTADSATTAGTATNVSAGEGTADAARHVWFSDSPTETKRAYSDKFKYNPVTNNLTVNVTGNAATASSVAWGNVTGKPSTYAPSAHNHNDSTITSLNASKLFGTIDIARLPHGALERLVIVTDDDARFKLTTADVQLGDTVKVDKTKTMYFVINESKLNSEEGYTVYTAGTATSVPWSGVTGKPTTFTPSSHTHPYLSALSASGRTITYTKGDGTTGTITTQDTWRGIQNNLTSDSTTDSLSAAQGKALKALVDGKAASSHTHKYAGSSSAGGSANSANKLEITASITGGNGNTTGYRLLKSQSLSAWNNYRATFIVNSIHEGCGVLSVGFGCNSATVSQANAYGEIIYFGLENSASVISDDSFQVYVSSDGKTAYLFEKYWDYSTLSITYLSGDFTVSNGTWTESIPAATYGALKAKTQINVARSVPWSGITGKPSSFTPSSHTHNYAGSSSAGGNANAAVKLANARKIGNASFDGTANITLSQMGLNVPVEITKADYLAKKKAGTLNANTYYNVIDEYDSANVINDSSVTANSAFSSTKSEKTYAKKSTLVTTTLTASKWTGSSAPYTYVLPVSGATTSNIVEINYASNASSQAIEAYQNAMLADGGQTTNQITIKATEKPTVDIPITIVIRNDL